MTKCRNCQREIAANAAACPHCGNRRTSCAVLGCAIFIGAVALLLLVSLIGDAIAS